MKLGIQDLDFTVALDIARLHLAGTDRFNVDGLDAVGIVQLGDQALDIEDDLRHVLLDAGDGGELVLNACDLDAGSGSAGQRREHNAAKRIAQRDAVAALERLHDKFAVIAVLGIFQTLNLGLFNFNHAVTLLLSSAVFRTAS